MGNTSILVREFSAFADLVGMSPNGLFILIVAIVLIAASSIGSRK